MCVHDVERKAHIRDNRTNHIKFLLLSIYFKYESASAMLNPLLSDFSLLYKVSE